MATPQSAAMAIRRSSGVAGSGTPQSFGTPVNSSSAMSVGSTESAPMTAAAHGAAGAGGGAALSPVVEGSATLTVSAERLGIDSSGSLAALAGRDEVYLFDLSTLTQVARLYLSGNHSVLWSKQETTRFVAVGTNSLHVASVGSGSARDLAALEHPGARDASWCPTDSNMLSSVSSDTLMIWDLRASSKPALKHDLPATKAALVSWCPDAPYTLATAHTTAVHLWDPRLTHTMEFSVHGSRVSSLSWGEAGCLLTASGDGTAAVWDLSKAHPSRSLTINGRDALSQALYAPDLGSIITVCGGKQAAIRVWQARGADGVAKELGQLHVASAVEPVRWVDWRTSPSSDSFQLVSWSQKNQLRLWSYPWATAAANTTSSSLLSISTSPPAGRGLRHSQTVPALQGFANSRASGHRQTALNTLGSSNAYNQSSFGEDDWSEDSQNVGLNIDEISMMPSSAQTPAAGNELPCPRLFGAVFSPTGQLAVFSNLHYAVKRSGPASTSSPVFDPWPRTYAELLEHRQRLASTLMVRKPDVDTPWSPSTTTATMDPDDRFGPQDERVLHLADDIPLMHRWMPAPTRRVSSSDRLMELEARGSPRSKPTAGGAQPLADAAPQYQLSMRLQVLDLPLRLPACDPPSVLYRLGAMKLETDHDNVMDPSHLRRIIHTCRLNVKIARARGATDDVQTFMLIGMMCQTLEQLPTAAAREEVWQHNPMCSRLLHKMIEVHSNKVRVLLAAARVLIQVAARQGHIEMLSVIVCLMSTASQRLALLGTRLQPSGSRQIHSFSVALLPSQQRALTLGHRSPAGPVPTPALEAPEEAFAGSDPDDDAAFGLATPASERSGRGRASSVRGSGRSGPATTPLGKPPLGSLPPARGQIASPTAVDTPPGVTTSARLSTAQPPALAQPSSSMLMPARRSRTASGTQVPVGWAEARDRRGSLTDEHEQHMTLGDKLAAAEHLQFEQLLASGHQRLPSHASRTLLSATALEAGRQSCFAFAEILYRWQLLEERAQLLHFWPTPTDTRDTIAIVATCPSGLHHPESAVCRDCHAFTVRCSVCDMAVKGLVSMCPGCGHGGHVQHLTHWFATEAECPVGCGCRCVEVGIAFAKLAMASSGGAVFSDPTATLEPPPSVTIRRSQVVQ